jgi:hypothetical protein
VAGDEPVRQAISIDISDDGLAATHPLQIVFPRAVAPTQPGKDEHNSLRDFLVVVGCAMFPDVTFQFDSSLIGPDAKAATRRLALFREELKDFPGLKDGEEKEFPPLALFGHADPVGQIPYNSKLSGRRALCVYGMMLRDVALWERLFQDKSLAGDRWGDPEFETMLDTVGFEPELPKGSDDEVARKQILARLHANPADRAKLFRDYMDAVCVKEDGKGGDEQFVLVKEDFLARGERADLKGDVMPCGEFNPVLILSNQRQREFDRTKDEQGRNAANEPNRRVLAFLFKPGTRIVPDKWPCPSTRDKQPEAECKKRLWKDSDRRLKPDETDDRTFKRTGDTMGCRFYHGFAQDSPCEGTLKLWVLRIGFDDDLKKDAQGKEIVDAKGRTELGHPIARKRYVVTEGSDAGSPIVRGRTDEKGGVRLPVFDEQTTMTLKLDAKSIFEPEDPNKRKEKEEEVPESEFIELVLKGGDLFPIAGQQPDVDAIAVRQRLSNLGYGPDKKVKDWSDDETKEALGAFQRKHKLQETGAIDDDTIAELKKVHGS